MNVRDISITKKILRAQLNGIDAPSKWFLVRVAWSFGSGLVDGTLDDLSRELELSRSRIISARNTFLQPLKNTTDSSNGYLVDQFTPGRAARGLGKIKGRPRQGFQLAPNFLFRLIDLEAQKQSRATDVPAHNHLIEHILFAPSGLSGLKGGGRGKAPSRSGAGKRLGVENRLLLALLWTLADENGVVWSYGASRIGKMAGMTRDQVSSQLKKLMRLGYVHARIGGVSGSRLFGKSDGAIFLEPFHPDWPCSQDGRRRKWIIMLSNEGCVGEINDAFRIANSIQREAQREAQRQKFYKDIVEGIKKTRWHRDTQLLRERIYAFETQGVRTAGRVTHDISDITALSSVASGQPLSLYQAFANAKSGERKYAHLVICRYATELLHRNAKDVLSDTKINGDVLSELQKEVCPKGKEEDQGWSMALAGWFYYWSCALAAEVLRWCADQLKVEPQTLAEKGRFLLIPIPGKDAVSILVYEPRGLGHT